MEFPQARPEVETEQLPNRCHDQVPVLKAHDRACASQLLGIPTLERM